MKPNLLLTIEEPGEVDPFDPDVATWKKVSEQWFALKPLEGEEAIRAAQMESRQSHTGRCEWFAGATTTMRLTDGQRVWNVESVANENEQNRFLVWRLIEVV